MLDRPEQQLGRVQRHLGGLEQHQHGDGAGAAARRRHAALLPPRRARAANTCRSARVVPARGSLSPRGPLRAPRPRAVVGVTRQRPRRHSPPPRSAWCGGQRASPELVPRARTRNHVLVPGCDGAGQPPAAAPLRARRPLHVVVARAAVVHGAPRVRLRRIPASVLGGRPNMVAVPPARALHTVYFGCER